VRGGVTHPVILAVDPGLTGAGAFLHYDEASARVHLRGVFDMPTRLDAATGKHVLDVPALARALRDHPLYNPSLAVIEKVGAAPGQGVTSMFTFGFNAGAIAGVCAALGIDATYVRPQHWQKHARVNIAANPTKTRKQVSLARANKLFPGQTKLFSRSKDHGRADAALIGYAYFSERYPVDFTV
jgi:crossover junction endodeoxyribonuclease RuvC